MKRFENVNFKLINLNSFKETTVHLNRMVKYIGRQHSHINPIDDNLNAFKRQRALLQRSIKVNEIKIDSEEKSDDNFAELMTM